MPPDLSLRAGSAVARTGLRSRRAAPTLFSDLAADRAPRHVLERAERLRDEMSFAVAHFAFAIGHRGRAVQHAAERAQFTAAGLHESHFHFDGDDADIVASQAARRHRER